MFVTSQFRRSAGTLVRTLIVAVATFAASACSSGNDDGRQTLVMSTYLPPSFAPYQAMLEWAADVEERSDVRVAFRFHHSGSLLPDQDTMPGIQDGRANGGIMTDLYHPDAFPLTGIVGVPFVTANPAAQGEVLLDLYDNNEAYRAEWDDNGLKLLGIGLVGPAVMSSADEMTNLDDITSKRLRGCGYLGSAMRAIGVDTVATTQSEQYEAVERGVLDGVACVPFDTADDFKYEEVAPNVLDPRTGLYTHSFLVMNLDQFNSLDRETQAVLEQLRGVYTQRTLDLLVAAEDAACEAFREAGGTFNSLSDADVATWRDAAYETELADWRQAAEGKGVDAVAFEEAYLSRMVAAEAANADYESAVERCSTRD